MQWPTRLRKAGPENQGQADDAAVSGEAYLRSHRELEKQTTALDAVLGGGLNVAGIGGEKEATSPIPLRPPGAPQPIKRRPVLSLSKLWPVRSFLGLVGHVGSLKGAEQSSLQSFGTSHAASRGRFPCLWV